MKIATLLLTSTLTLLSSIGAQADDTITPGRYEHQQQQQRDNAWQQDRESRQAANANGANGNSKSCGNCDYLAGSYCRSSDIAKVSQVVLFK